MFSLIRDFLSLDFIDFKLSQTTKQPITENFNKSD